LHWLDLFAAKPIARHPGFPSSIFWGLGAAGFPSSTFGGLGAAGSPISTFGGLGFGQPSRQHRGQHSQHLQPQPDRPPAALGWFVPFPHGHSPAFLLAGSGAPLSRAQNHVTATVAINAARLVINSRASGFVRSMVITPVFLDWQVAFHFVIESVGNPPEVSGDSRRKNCPAASLGFLHGLLQPGEQLN